MDNQDKVEITGRQMMLSLLGIIAGGSVLGLPRLMATEADRDAWIPIIIGSLAPLLVILISISLFKRFPGYNFHRICCSILGKFFGRIPLAIYVIYGIFFCSIIIRSFSDMLDTYVLPETPHLVKTALLLLAALYTVLPGIKVIARFNEVTIFIYLAMPLFLLPSLRVAQWTFLLPVATTPVYKLLHGALVAAMSYTGMEYLLVLYPFVSDKKKAVKNSLLALVIITVLYLCITINCIAVFGPYYIKRHIWPVLVLLKLTEIPVLERLEYFFILFYIVIIFRPIMNQLFASSYLTSQIFGAGEFRSAAIPLSIIIFVISNILPNIVETFKYMDYVGMAGMASSIILPALLLLLSIIFKKGAGSNKKN